MTWQGSATTVRSYRSSSLRPCSSRLTATCLPTSRSIASTNRRVRTGRVVEHALQAAGLAVNEYLELNSIETIVALVRENIGVTVLPLLHRGNWHNDPSLRVLSISNSPVLRTVGMIHRASYDRRAITQAIIDTLHGS